MAVLMPSVAGLLRLAAPGCRSIPSVLLAFVLVLGTVASGHAQTEVQAAEHRVKAAFLYRFGSFIEWPPQAFPRADTPLTIGVLGADAIADELAQTVQGRTINGRPVVVRKLRRGEPLAGLHILFVGRQESARFAEIAAAIRGQPTLVVSESDDALRHGSMINFVVVDDKVRFDVALPSAEQGGIKISARLLLVARNVVTGSS